MSGLSGAAVLSKEYSSGEAAVTAAGLVSMAHGLGVTPKVVLAYAVCVVAEKGYAIGDVVLIGSGNMCASSTAPDSGVSLSVNDTTIEMRYGTDGLWVLHGTTGARGELTNARWNVIVKAYV